VNGVNVEWENYSRVADMIRAGGNKLDLLVVDDASDQFFDQEDIMLSREQPFVDVIVCPDELVTNANGLYTIFGYSLIKTMWYSYDVCTVLAE